MNYRFWKFLKILVIVIAAVTVFGYVTMSLWNWLMPPIFGLHTITFVQALGLLILGKILFGGFHRHARCGPRGWHRGKHDRWAHLSPEERERFRSGMRDPWCRPRSEPPTPEPTAL